MDVTSGPSTTTAADHRLIESADPSRRKPAIRPADDTRDTCTDLVVAHAISLAIRGEVGPAATEELLEAAHGDLDRLELAFRRCLECDVLDQGTVRRAARLLQRSVYFSTTGPPVGSA